MGFVELFELNGVQIETTVTSKEEEVDDLLWSNFLYPANGNRTKVIGFDTEWLLFQNTESEEIYSETKSATVHLCDGYSCLIIQLYHLDSVPISLLNFLRLPDYTFVGVGIKDNVAKLEKHYGIGCRNAVELGPLAASIMKMPRLSFCGVDELAFVVNRLDIQKHRPLSAVFKDWGQDNLSKKLAKLATVNVYSYYMIGSNLLRSD